MSEVDVSDAVAPARPRKHVAWRDELVVSSFDGTLISAPPADAAAMWTELWFQNEEFDVARREARIERIGNRCGASYKPVVPRAYVGSKRPAMGAALTGANVSLFDPALLPDAEDAPNGW